MSRCWDGEFNKYFEQEAWLGYEFWSVQIEAEMEPLEPGNMQVCLAGRPGLTAVELPERRGASAQPEGANDVLPF